MRVIRIGSLAEGGLRAGSISHSMKPGHFSLAMEGETIVSGSAAVKRQAGTTVITLSPTQPDWATAREVRVTCSRDGDLLTAVTTIGRG